MSYPDDPPIPPELRDGSSQGTPPPDTPRSAGTLFHQSMQLLGKTGQELASAATPHVASEISQTYARVAAVAEMLWRMTHENVPLRTADIPPRRPG